MEKICIVQRRKKDVRAVEKGKDYITDKEVTPSQDLGVILSKAVKNNISGLGGEETSVDEVIGHKHEVVSFNLTPEQCKLIQSSDFVQCLSGGISSGSAINIEQEEDGQISLSFHFDRVNVPKMLKTEHVCEMLQISKSFLRKLIRTGRLKSYKLGRLRRFSLEDVLEYLARSEYFENPSIRS
jgi:excisionase family DNA binding protein